MSLDSLELQLAGALTRFTTLQRRADTDGVTSSLLSRTLTELEKALEELRVAQEQLVENRDRIEQMQAELTQQYERYRSLFDEMPDAYVITEPDTRITDANKAAAELLNVSQRFLVGKALSVFVCENRVRFLQEATRAAEVAGTSEFAVRIRPRERAPLEVAARVTSGTGTLRWVVRPL